MHDTYDRDDYVQPTSVHCACITTQIFFFGLVADLVNHVLHFCVFFSFCVPCFYTFIFMFLASMLILCSSVNVSGLSMKIYKCMSSSTSLISTEI